MEINSVLYYVGVVAVAICIYYFVRSLYDTQGSIVEGLKNKDSKSSVIGNLSINDVKSLKKDVENLQDTLLISKYKTDYEDLLLDLDKILDYNILYYLTILPMNIDNKGGLQKDTFTSIPLINDLYKLKDNLNETMNFLDSEAGSVASKTKSFFS